ncbi:MAG: hypothetical protein HY235_02550 [Acidobacteria bacterium]|nr:hypothetical protein [Acidobacteriota bacterium]
MSAPAPTLAPVRLLLFGLDAPLATELETALSGHVAMINPDPPDDVAQCRCLLEEARANLLFCPARAEILRVVLEAARSFHLPVVVVSPYPEVDEWLNAIEAGAVDYATPPFERKQMQWILASSLRTIEAA